MGFDEHDYDDPALPLHIIKKRRVHQLRDWARAQNMLPPMYYEDPIHGITKDQLRELLIGIANGIYPDAVTAFQFSGLFRREIQRRFS